VSAVLVSDARALRRVSRMFSGRFFGPLPVARSAGLAFSKNGRGRLVHDRRLSSEGFFSILQTSGAHIPRATALPSRVSDSESPHLPRTSGAGLHRGVS
jgi:hypothetical protein